MLSNYFHLLFSKQFKGTIVSPLIVRNTQETVKWQTSKVMNIYSEKINIYHYHVKNDLTGLDYQL